MKILIADDNRLLAMILGDHLVERGHHVVPAFDGRLALYFCEQHDFDWVLLDLDLPRLAGIELLTHLRDEQQTFRAIVISKFADLLAQMSTRLAALGVEAMIEKPFSFSDVVDVIEQRQFLQ